jgi:hypothetical protein
MWSQHAEIALLQAPNHACCLAFVPLKYRNCRTKRSHGRPTKPKDRRGCPSACCAKQYIAVWGAASSQLRRREADDRHDRLGEVAIERHFGRAEPRKSLPRFWAAASGCAGHPAHAQTGRAEDAGRCDGTQPAAVRP